MDKNMWNCKKEKKKDVKYKTNNKKEKRDSKLLKKGRLKERKE